MDAQVIKFLYENVDSVKQNQNFVLRATYLQRFLLSLFIVCYNQQNNLFYRPRSSVTAVPSHDHFHVASEAAMSVMISRHPTRTDAAACYLLHAKNKLADSYERAREQALSTRMLILTKLKI